MGQQSVALLAGKQPNDLSNDFCPDLLATAKLVAEAFSYLPLLIESLRTERNQFMAIGLLTLELYLPLNDSLKGKRGILKPLIARLRRDYNVSICEAEAQDTLTRAVLEVVCVSANGALAHRQLQTVAQRVEGWRMDAQLIDYHIEMVG